MKIYSQSGTFISEFPFFTNLSVMDTINDVGSFSFNWNFNASGGSNLISDSALQMAVCLDFKDGNGFTEVWRGWYEQDTYDPSMAESAIIQASGRSMVAILAQAVVYPQGGVGNTTTSWSFTGSSAGTIMNTLITAAKARGCFPGLNVSFTNGQDSSGNAWAHGFTNAFQAGTSYLDLLTGLAQSGLCDFNMTGTTLNIYNPNTTLAQDLSNTIVLRRGRELITVPAQRDRTQLGTAMLAIGDNGVNVEVDAPTLGTLGRYEVYLAQAGVTDSSTLTYFASQAITAVDDQQISLTPSVAFNVQMGTPRPWKDFPIGSYISIDLSGVPTKYRARTWVLQSATGAACIFQPTLNDVFYDREVLIANAVHGVTSGAITGVGGVPVTSGTPAPGKNPTVPNAPAFQTASCYTAAYYSPATGTTLAQLELQWTTPTNTDSTTMIDGQTYLVQYRLATVPIYPLFWSQVQGKTWSSINGNPWTNVLATPQNTQWTTVQVSINNNNVIIPGLICGETYQFQIACSDVSGNTSAFSSITSFLTATDNVAPGQPSAPTVAASMVAVQVTHNLTLNAGGNLPQDLNHLEVHYSYDPSFTPIPGVGSNTYLGKMHATAGMINAGIEAMGNFNVTTTTGIYIKVIAVDESGNSSPASPGSGVTAVLIDDQHISSLSVSKLIAGTVTATIIMGGTITTSLTGQRVTMDSSGFHAYDANGNQIFNVSSSSPTITLGVNGTSGNSIKIDTSQTFPTIYFNVSGGPQPSFINGWNAGTGATGININSAPYSSPIDASTVSRYLFINGNGAGAVIESDDTSGIPHGSSITFADEFVSLFFYNHGNSINGGLTFELNNTFTDTAWEIDGYNHNSGAVAPSNNEAMWAGRIDSLAAGTTSVTNVWGPTMASNPIVVAVPLCVTTSPVPSSMVSGVSTTSFTFQTSGSFGGLWSIFFWAWRYR